MIEITNKADCCGCTSCFSICTHEAIEMKHDIEGFLYPSIDLAKCTNCGACEKVCPVIFRDRAQTGYREKQIYAAQHIDKNKLFNSSSGGVYTALAEYVINRGGCVVGVEYSAEMKVRHSFAFTIEECYKFRGSKYVQSDTQGIYPKVRDILKTGRLLLFTGTPCQVEGLKLFLKREYINLITVDLICHGVASPKIFNDYINFCNEKLGKHIIWLAMRDKTRRGWSQDYSSMYYFSDGTHLVDPKHVSIWQRLYFSHLINRPSCHECRFANLERCGDFTLGDFLDLSNLRKDLRGREGMSLLMVNTQMGTTILKEMKDELKLWNSNIAESIQPCLKYPVKAGRNREKFWNYYENNGFDKAYDKYFKQTIIRILLRYYRRSKLLKQIGHPVKMLVIEVLTRLGIKV